MVSLRPGRRGASTFGCLVMAVLFGAAVFYGLHVGEIYLRYWQLLDDMRQQAKLARLFPDDSIHRHLTAQADSLLGEAPRFQIHRGANRVTISTEYSEQLDLPLLKRTVVLRPRAEEPY
jgi:hypothetical protein